MIKRNASSIVLALGLSLSFAVLVSCSSGVQKADIPTSADPREEVSKLENDIGTAITKNIDVLAADEFKKSRSSLNKAKSAMSDGKSQSNVLDTLRTGRGHLQAAYAKSAGREQKAEGLFAARQMTLNAGANTHPALQSDLNELDSDVAAKASDLSEVSADKIAALQQRYVELEKRSVAATQLGRSQAMVNGAKKDDAEDKAPISFKKAELSLKTAESMISTNVRNPSGYAASVAKANKDALQLANVMMIIQQNGKNLKESVAIKMVAQNKAISGLSSDLSNEIASGAAEQSAMQAKNDSLSTDIAAQGKQLQNATGKVRIQRALEQARSKFSPSEAEAYQQGENLVVRLKQVNFASGRSDLPANALPLLAKVSEVAKSLNASTIRVEGHTDSVGAAAQNQTISQDRASAVASYFKTNGFSEATVASEGFGFQKPIATNKSKEGRAQNRRVDVIITPDTSKN